MEPCDAWRRWRIYTVEMGGNALALASGLVARAREGDQEALESVYRAYETQVYSLARRILGNEADAQDVLQDTFLEVCRSIGKYRGEGSLWGWIRQVTVSKALMHLRRERVRAASPLDSDGYTPGALSKMAEPTAPLELEAALLRLSPVARAVLWLHEVEGYTHQEIGEMMGKTASFSKSQLSRTHQRLRELYA
jgi:RNA polymerase sigma factor (sigma-70 family)